MFLRIRLHRLHDVTRAENLELNVRMPALQLETIDANTPGVLQPPRVTFAEEIDRNRDNDQRRDGE